MKLMMAMMRMLPEWITRKIKPSALLPKERIDQWKTNPAGIDMNLSNLLICADYCGSCPSKPQAKGDGVYCATGKSLYPVEEKGCKCFDCPLFKQCGPGSGKGYFCISGVCSHKDVEDADSHCGSYLKRFLPRDESTITTSEPGDTAGDEIIFVQLDFSGDRLVDSESHIPILEASLNANIPHTHVCGGQARCSTCRVLILEGLENLKPRNEKEKRLAKIKGFPYNVRLACQTKITGDIRLRRLVFDDQDINEAVSQGAQSLGEQGREQHLSILFSDIRSFTSFSEKSLPYDIIHILNRYFEAVGHCIDENGGYIDKYMGDGIMAIFGLGDHDKSRSSYLAVNAALSMTHALKEFNTYLKDHFDHEFAIGIGVHTGNVIIGNMGYHKKMDFTAIGDTVNTASRIESVNKQSGTSILVSDRTYQEVKDQFKWKKKVIARVKGKEQALSLYEPMDHL